jgi:GNAT superfamily N-acetyltransferase
METYNKGILNRFSGIATIIKNGLFWHGVRNNLARIGFDFMPYYLCKSVSKLVIPDHINSPDIDLKFSIFGTSEINYIKNSIIGIGDKRVFKDLNDGVICAGLKKNNDIIAFLFIRKKPFYFRKRFLKLGKSECFFEYVYVYEKYRGKGVAPYLRRLCCKLLEKEAIYTIYSICECFNYSAIAYLNKFKVKRLELCLSINLFKKQSYHVTLKRY